jgi:predicted RNase H-like nuclease (RuvC/YqgF family)
MKSTLKDFNSKIVYLQYTIRETEARIEELKYENESLANGEYEEFGYDEDDNIDYIISENESRIEEYEDELAEFEQLLVVESLAAISDSDRIKKFKEIADKEDVSEITSSYKVAVNPIWVEGSIYGRYIKRYDDGTDDDETALWILVAYVANSVIEPENMTAQDIDALIANAESIEYGFDTLDSDVAIGFAREFLKAIER